MPTFDPTTFQLRPGICIKCLDCDGQPVLNPAGNTPNVYAYMHFAQFPTHRIDLDSLIAVTNEYYVPPAGG